MKKLIICSSLMLFCAALSAQEQWNLNQCIDHAIANNLSIKQQEDNVEQKRISLNTSQNNRLPNVSASGSEGLGFGRGLTANNTYANRNTQSTSLNLGADVPVFTGGQLSNQIKVSKLDLQAAIADLSKAKESMAIQVVSSYLEAIYQKDLVDVNERQKALSEAQLTRVEKLFNNGKESESQVAEIRSQVAKADLQLTQQKNSAMLALLDLSQLLELSTPEGFDIVRPETTDATSVLLMDPDAVYAEALGIKPQIEADKLRLQSAEKSVDVAKAGYYPSVHLSAGMGSSYYKTSGYEAASLGKQFKDNFNQSLSLSLNIPIFDRFSTRNSVRQARLQVHTQQLQMEETKKTLYKEIQQAYYNALAAQKQCISSDAALKSSQESFNLMQKKFENGKATATEYQESLTNLLQAETTAIQSRYTFFFREKILNFYRGIAF